MLHLARPPIVASPFDSNSRWPPYRVAAALPTFSGPARYEPASLYVTMPWAISASSGSATRTSQKQKLLDLLVAPNVAVRSVP